MCFLQSKGFLQTLHLMLLYLTSAIEGNICVFSFCSKMKNMIHIKRALVMRDNDKGCALCRFTLLKSGFVKAFIRK